MTYLLNFSLVCRVCSWQSMVGHTCCSQCNKYGGHGWRQFKWRSASWYLHRLCHAVEVNASQELKIPCSKCVLHLSFIISYSNLIDARCDSRSQHQKPHQTILPSTESNSTGDFRRHTMHCIFSCFFEHVNLPPSYVKRTMYPSCALTPPHFSYFSVISWVVLENCAVVRVWHYHIHVGGCSLLLAIVSLSAENGTAKEANIWSSSKINGKTFLWCLWNVNFMKKS